jgi:hypothetical protein
MLHQHWTNPLLEERQTIVRAAHECVRREHHHGAKEFEMR